MNHTRKAVINFIESNKNREKKQLTFNVKPELINDMDRIVSVLTNITNTVYNRNMLLENAMESFIEETKDYLKEKYSIDIYEDIKNEKEEKIFDTVIYPGHIDGFEDVFLKSREWYYVRIKNENIKKVKYIAVYVGKPISAVTHYAKVKAYVESKEMPGKYIVVLDGDPIALPKPIKLGNISSSSTRSPKYTTLDKLIKANEFSDL